MLWSNISELAPMTFKVTRASSADTGAPTPIPRGRRAQARLEEERRIQQEKLNMLEVKILNDSYFKMMCRIQAKLEGFQNVEL